MILVSFYHQERFWGQLACIDLYLDIIQMGARWLDPSLGRWLSADTIVPDPANPQSLNRYSYVYNNPLRYVDPSGHIASDQERNALEIIERLLNDYGVTVEVDFGWQLVTHPAPGEAGLVWAEGAWDLPELETVLQAVGDTAGFMGGADAFRSNLGGVWMSRKDYKRSPGATLGHHIWFWFNDFDKWAVVHELAHVWDNTTGNQLSQNLEAYTGGWTDANGLYTPGGTPPKGADGRFTRREDFAESVATFLYPGQAQDHIARYFRNQPLFIYSNYYRMPRAMYVATQVQYDPQQFMVLQTRWDPQRR